MLRNVKRTYTSVAKRARIKNRSKVPRFATKVFVATLATISTELEVVADDEIELELGADLDVVTELEAEMVVQLRQKWKLEIGEFAE
ncbi:hypothetical protein DY000_02055154 [Brassica cretica]|uniref:Uncharacterized protein n=1 Tax=Brassica cretica TaxID=69181 RepID=A0ABQ7A5T6_BRACR|nr:hypothetical protein DY000_02055154 [Brassica cretica]